MDDIYGRGGGKLSFISGLHLKWVAGKDFWLLRTLARRRWQAGLSGWLQWRSEERF